MTPAKPIELELKLPDWLPEDAKGYAKTNLRVLNLYIREHGQLTENQNSFFEVLKLLFTEEENKDGIKNHKELKKIWKALSKRGPEGVQNFCYCIGDTLLSKAVRVELLPLTDFSYKCNDLRRIFKKIAKLLSQCNSYTKFLNQHINISFVLKNTYLYEKACHAGELPSEFSMNSNVSKYTPQIPKNRLDTMKLSLLYRQSHPQERPSSEVLLEHDFCNLLDLLYAVGRVTVELIKGDGTISYKLDPLVKMQNELEKHLDQAILMLKQDQQEFFNVGFKAILAAIIKDSNNKPSAQITLLEYMHNPNQGITVKEAVSEESATCLGEFFKVLPNLVNNQARERYSSMKDEYDTKGNSEKYLWAAKLHEFMAEHLETPLYDTVTRILELAEFRGNLEYNKYTKEASKALHAKRSTPKTAKF